MDEITNHAPHQHQSKLNQMRAQRDIHRRLKEHQWCIDRFIGSHTRYLSWMPRTELEALLLNALWDALKKWDNNPEETRDFYLVFWYQCKHELSLVWRKIAKEKGRTRSTLYNPDFQDFEHVHDWVESVHTEDNPMNICIMLERLERLPPKHQEVLHCLAGAGHKAYAQIAEEMGMIDQQAVIREMKRVKDTLENDAVPNAIGIKKQVINRLGLTDDKLGQSQASRVLGKAREELGLKIPAGGRYSYEQSKQVMAWLDQGNNPVAASIAPMSPAHRSQPAPASLPVVRRSPSSHTATVSGSVRTSQSARPPLKS